MTTKIALIVTNMTMVNDNKNNDNNNIKNNYNDKKR